MDFIEQEVDDANKISLTLAKIAEADTMARSAAAGKDLVLVVGNTGAGKSTFLNYLIGKRMVEAEVPGSLQNGFRCEDPVFEIGFGFESKTEFPQVYFDGGSGLTYCDCPGFNDNRGVDFDVSNMYAISALAKSATSVRCFLLLDYHALCADRGLGMRSLMHTSEKMFGTEGNASLGLIVSKVPPSASRARIVDFLMSSLDSATSSEFSAWAAQSRPALWHTVFQEAMVYDPLDRCADSSRARICESIRRLETVTVDIHISADSEVFLSRILDSYGPVVMHGLGQRSELTDVRKKLHTMHRLFSTVSPASPLGQKWQSFVQNVGASLFALGRHEANESLLHQYGSSFEGAFRDDARAALASLEAQRNARDDALRREREMREAAERERERIEREEAERRRRESEAMNERDRLRREAGRPAVVRQQFFYEPVELPYGSPVFSHTYRPGGCMKPWTCAKGWDAPCSNCYAQGKRGQGGR